MRASLHQSYGFAPKMYHDAENHPVYNLDFNQRYASLSLQIMTPNEMNWGAILSLGGINEKFYENVCGLRAVSGDWRFCGLC